MHNKKHTIYEMLLKKMYEFIIMYLFIFILFIKNKLIIKNIYFCEENLKSGV